tara:strand:- start:59 stop:1570 length:1512 start_codon:yes stop_codon:yes gene_type:complete
MDTGIPFEKQRKMEMDFLRHKKRQEEQKQKKDEELLAAEMEAARLEQEEKDEKEAERRRLLSLQYKGISEFEQERQNRIDEGFKQKREQLKEIEEIAGSDSKEFKQASSALAEEEAAEKERRENQSLTFLQRIAKSTEGLSGKFKDFVGKTPTALKALLAGAAFFVLAKFLKSDSFKKITDFIVDDILPALEDFYEDIKEFDFTLTGENGLLALIKDNFMVLLGALALLKPTLIVNLAVAALKGTFSALKFMALELKKNPFGVRFAKTKRFIGIIKASMFGIFGVIKGLAIKLAALLAPLLANPITLIIAAIVAIIGGIIYIFKDEIMAKFKELGGIAGIFSRVIANIKDALSSVANNLIKAYNFLTNSDVELFDTNRAQEVDKKIKADIQSKKIKESYGLTEEQMFANIQKGLKAQEEEAKKGSKSLENIDNKTPEKKQLSAEEMTIQAMNKLAGLMQGKSPTVVQNNINNSKNNNAKNVTQNAIPATDVSGMRLVNGQYVA